jgi:hypothetical protein
VVRAGRGLGRGDASRAGVAQGHASRVVTVDAHDLAPEVEARPRVIEAGVKPELVFFDRSADVGADVACVAELLRRQDGLSLAVDLLARPFERAG